MLTNTLNIQEKINYYLTTLQLHPHETQPDNYLIETYRDQAINIDTAYYEGNQRAASTFVHYMLTNTGIMRLHKVKSGKYWQFIDGCPLLTYILDERAKTLTTYLLGNLSLHGTTVKQF